MIKPGGLKLCAVFYLTMVLSACYGSSVSDPKSEAPFSENRIPFVYLVTVAGQPSMQELETLFARYGVSNVKRIDSQLYQVTLIQDPGLQPLQALVKESSMIKHIQPVYIYRTN